jgi:predicted NBD/HSP70 family sugar kinase
MTPSSRRQPRSFVRLTPYRRWSEEVRYKGVFYDNDFSYPTRPDIGRALSGARCFTQHGHPNPPLFDYMYLPLEIARLEGTIMTRRIGVDLGGSWLRLGVVDTAAKRDLVRHLGTHPSPTSWDGLVDLLARHNSDDVHGYAVAISGPVFNHSTLIRGPNLPWLSGRNVREGLEVALGKKVVVCNDMEAATEGEMARGVLRQYSWAIFDTISTGWGGNLILNGQRADGEPGHANVSFDRSERCGAGHVGCLESLYSGSALERRFRQQLEQTNDRSERDVTDLWAWFYAELNDQAAWAISLVEDWAEGVGRAWANTLNRIRPLQAIVYMGTTAEMLLAIPRVKDRVRSTIQQICMFPDHQSLTFPILQAQFEHRSLYGAVIVYEKHASEFGRLKSGDRSWRCWPD